ncbi:PhzF family phenazine biosynthesis protein [Psychrosphaera sp. B3R10]|uniref:PhzF family phenazine biosynthesis protein n=1 Tax=unclassified Psychrosphaera TaxID=2641570 RepID=UPI001C097B96|nr:MULTISPECIES: PhzF family phenazine biosynthesis protein [unclassified Psychrosphaera]MBU2882802.1 PhzF family phenazine biosynthesis protein [Psychrosphaera sp. I2R16]MBU2988048.1 PhzF family phenazine biosynthesis protein [Psychrosphaera sp. B3R10]
MKLPIYIVDAFTNTQFKGNSAAVVLLDTWLDDGVMQSIAIENNLSETAFISIKGHNAYDIRWFSPITEIDFCGHATLAASFVLFEYYQVTGELQFSTDKVGDLFISRQPTGFIEMKFPNQEPEPVLDIPSELLAGLSKKPIEVLKNRQAYFAIFETEEDVTSLQYESEALKSLAPLDVVVTATGDKYDFVSRYFWPANGGDEDPVTGSIHSGLTPYWSKKLNKTELKAYQASFRGGELFCSIVGEQVLVSGQAVVYLTGTIDI